MKSGRLLLIVGGIIGLLLVLAVAAAFTAKVQTWAVHRALAGQPGLTVGRVSAGLNHVKLDDVRVVQPGMVLTLPSAEADLSIVSAMRSRLFVKRLVAHGWTLDLTQSTVATPPAATAGGRPRVFSFLPSAYADVPPATVAAPALFRGIFDQLKLPVDLSLDGVDLSGDVILPAVKDRPAAKAKVTITGGGLAAGKPGKFDYTAVVGFIGADVTVREVTIRGTLGVIMDTPRTIARLVASTEAEAVGPKFPTGVKLNVDGSAARSPHGEVYAVSISSGAKQLAAAETGYPAGATHLTGNWRVDMRDADLAPFSFGRDLPAFEAAGDGRFETDTGFSELRASGKLNATLDRLQVISAQLAGIGAVHVTAEFDFAQRDAATRVDQLSVTIEGAKPVATVKALQAFEFNLKTGELNVADPSQELLGVSLHGLPLAWVGPLLAKEGLIVTGDDLRGGFSASARNGGFALRPKEPLAVTNLNFSKVDGAKYLTAVDVSLSASADYTPQGWQVELAPLGLRSKAGTVLSIEGKVGQLSGKGQPTKATATWSAQLPALFGQPIAAGIAALTAGDVRGTLVANIGEKLEGEVKVALTNLSAVGAPALPTINLDLRADREATGKVTFSAPILLERDGRKSDLTLAGTLIPSTSTSRAVDVRLTSDFLAIEDAQVLAAPFGRAPVPADPKASPSAVAAGPFWSGVNGQVTLALKKVVYNNQFQVTDFTGTLRIDAGAVKLVNGRGGFDTESDVKLAGGVSYSATTPEPYTLAADFEVNNFATAPAFRAVDPSRTPTVEARLNLTRKLNGTGASLLELAARTRGDLLITSKGGIFRGLSADLTDRIQKTQSRVTAIANFLGVVPDDYVNKTAILSDIVKSLAEIPFDQLSVTATRDPGSNLQLTDFTLISPEVRIVGEGEIKYVDGVALLAQPMSLRLNLGARGKLGDLIKRAGLLESRKDNLGYAAFSVPLRIGGTAANPDTNDIRNALLNSALERSGLLDSLLGK